MRANDTRHRRETIVHAFIWTDRISLVRMFSHMRLAIRKFIAVLGAVIGRDASKKHGLVRFKRLFQQFTLDLIPT